ncbi:MAG TPA: hypothetical protein VFV86_01965, partial [Nitrososphaeraceae archaeon]|nr:hypothetical protein [Nitrososphaeraceae archaeon]
IEKKRKMSRLISPPKLQYMSIISLLSICFCSPYGIAVQAQQESASMSNTNLKNDRINLSIENLAVERSVTNLVQIKGDIRNNNTNDVHEVKISAEFYDKTGLLLESVEHFITSPSQIFKPGEKLSFNILETIGFNKLGNYTIVANSEPIE